MLDLNKSERHIRGEWRPVKNIKESICIKNELMFLAAKPGTLALFIYLFLFLAIEGHISWLSGKSDVPTPGS